MSLILLGLCLLAIAAVAALVHGLVHVEEGYEDASGFHRGELPVSPEKPNDWATVAGPVAPEMYPNGSTCPWGIDPAEPDSHLPA